MCLLGNLEQARDYQEQKKGKEIITRKNRKKKKKQMCVCTYLSVLVSVGLSVFLRVMKDRRDIEKVSKWRSHCVLSLLINGGQLARCRANKVFLMALKCIIYFKKLGFVLLCEKQFAKWCSTICPYLL